MDVSSILINQATGLVSFGFPLSGPVKLEGIFELVQLAVYTILRTTSGDQARPDYGTTFLQMTGSSTINDMNALKADIAMIIKNAESKIIKEQKGYNNLSADKTLSSMTLLRVAQDTTDPTIINIWVSVKNISGQVYNFGIPSIRS